MKYLYIHVDSISSLFYRYKIYVHINKLGWNT